MPTTSSSALTRSADVYSRRPAAGGRLSSRSVICSPSRGASAVIATNNRSRRVTALVARSRSNAPACARASATGLVSSVRLRTSPTSMNGRSSLALRTDWISESEIPWTSFSPSLIPYREATASTV